MGNDEYHHMFGEVRCDRPFGQRVYEGMAHLFHQYMSCQKKAWQLADCQKFMGTFRAPWSFSKHNALQPFNPATDHLACQYPAMFFLDVYDGRVYMVCLKMVIGDMAYWEIDRSRAGPMLPHDSDREKLANEAWNFL